MRRYASDGGLYAFNDSVIIGIKSKSGETNLFLFVALQKSNDVYVTIARPYLYADTIYANGVTSPCFNYLVGTEKYEVEYKSLLEHYSVIENSGGNLACFNVR